MKPSLTRHLAICLIAALVCSPAAFAQRKLGQKKGPISKMYMAETVGDSQIQNGDKIYTARQATAFDAPGTVIVTKAGAHNAIVYSNGTGMFVDQNTRVEIDRFDQESFNTAQNARLDSRFEPSVSQSSVHVSQGAVGICTSQLISGSSMNYSTPLGNVNIRGGKVSIEATPEATYIDLMEGDITVRGSGGRDVGGQVLRPGERATITPSTTGGQPTVTVGPIPPAALQASEGRTETACNAKKTVTFDVIEKKAQQGLDAPEEPVSVAQSQPLTEEEKAAGAASEAAGAAADEDTQVIVARPTVPASNPVKVVVSPDRLPGT